MSEEMQGVSTLEQPTPTPATTSTASSEPEVEQMPPLDQIDVPSGGGDMMDEGPALRSGTVVTGVVVKIDSDGVLVDIGAKSEGLIRPNELSREPNQHPSEVVKIDEKIVVVVLEEMKDGTFLLSKKRADFEKAWDRVQAALKSGEVLNAKVIERVKGGLVVDLGVRGFVPASHVGNGKHKNLDKFMDVELPLKVLEVDRGARKVVVSHRLATEEEREAARVNLMTSLKEGDVKMGIVRRVTEYGAFVDLGGVDGLLHVSEMSWTRVKHPNDVVRTGQEVQVKILRIGSNEGRISLGMRQILPDPWDTVTEKFHIGDTVEGEITRPVPFGAFILLENGIEGIIPNSELSHRRILKSSDVVEAGQVIQVKVIDIRPDERRMTLSLRALLPRDAEPELRPGAGAPSAATDGSAPKKKKRRGRDDDEGGGGGDFRAYVNRGASDFGLSLGDVFGSMFDRNAKPAKREKRRPVEDEDEDLSDIDFDTEVTTEAEAAVDADVIASIAPEPVTTIADVIGADSVAE
jgi:ribosomal protein S1